MELAGRVAIVTGAGAGIGHGIATRLSRQGASVLLVDRDADTVEAAADEMATPAARPFVADVSSIDAAGAVAAAAVDAFGGIDILVNNAGGVDEPCFPDNPVEQWLGVIQLNLIAVMAMTQAVLPSMASRGVGAIVNIASAAALGDRPHSAPEYAAAKAGVVRLTTALGDLASASGVRVRVNCICPDWVDTPASRRTKAAMSADQLAHVPPVLLTADQIASAVQYLIEHDDAVGQVLVWWCGDDTWRFVRPQG